MSLKQIAKELHIELVVLHDQDGFGHPVPPVPKAAGAARPMRPVERT
jgi:hypothetical protein